MKRFIIDTKIQNHSLEVNNCIDFKIAGACAIFNKNFFPYYCAYWSLLKNWSDYSSDFSIRKCILNKFQIEISTLSVKKEDLIDNIINCLDNDKPVLLDVLPKTLFFSTVYKNCESNNIKHILLITGYDESRKLFYIYENSINREKFFDLLKKNPLFEYQITADMLKEIIDENCIFQKNFLKDCVFYLRKKCDILDSELSNMLVNVFWERRQFICCLI